MTEASQETGAWHLDKRVPIALIFAIILQSATVVWFISNLRHQLDTVITENGRQDTRLDNVENGMNAQAVNAATFTAQVSALRESMTELKAAQAETNRLLRDIAGSQP